MVFMIVAIFVPITFIAIIAYLLKTREKDNKWLLFLSNLQVPTPMLELE